MTVTVVAIDGDWVRLGSTAPLNVDVYRRELLDKMGSPPFLWIDVGQTFLSASSTNDLMPDRNVCPT